MHGEPEKVDKRDSTPGVEQYFYERLLEWAQTHGRSFPWRETREPYQVLIAEMMLRRTRASQVVPVYTRFLELFPTIDDLLVSPDEDVAAVLYPLGLAWRAANFRRMAEHVATMENGQIPRERSRLLMLPGVGDYVASAVRCLAFNEDELLIDTNTVRVAGRYLGFPTHAESRRHRPVREAVGHLIDHRQPRASNLALLDFAALVCRAPQPLCTTCPVSQPCAWFQTQGAGSPDNHEAGGV